LTTDDSMTLLEDNPTQRCEARRALRLPRNVDPEN
jgi:hypothetical protein